MKKIILILVTLIFTNCKAQNIKNISQNTEMNYVFSRIYHKDIINKNLFNSGLFVSIYRISDSKVTPDDFSKETEEFLDSYIISVTPDGDYYSTSKLYKIEGIYNPKIVEVKEGQYPKFTIKVEFGEYKKKKQSFSSLKE